MVKTHLLVQRADKEVGCSFCLPAMDVDASPRFRLVESDTVDIGVRNIPFKTSVKYLGCSFCLPAMAVDASPRFRLVESDTVDIGVRNIPFKTSVKYLGVKTFEDYQT